MSESRSEYESGVYKSFEQSEYGQSLAGKPRWNHFRPEIVSSDEWINILGPSADNVKHMHSTLGVTKLFLKYDDGSLGLNEEEADILRLAATIHDWGKSYDLETGVGGDISYERKTNEDIELEKNKFHLIFDELIGKDEVKLKYLLSSIVFSSENKIGKIFNAIERVGYLVTAQRAFRQSKLIDEDEVSGNLQWLTADVLSNQMIPLMEYAGTYTPVKKYLEVVSPFVDSAYESIDANIFSKHNQIERGRVERYNQSRVMWSRGPSHSAEMLKIHNKNIFSDNANYEARFIDNYEKLKTHIEACRAFGLEIVLTSGSFDLLHIGHMKYLEKAAEYGDILIVGVDSDKKIQARKGPNRPVVDEVERTKMLSHVRNVGIITLKRHDDEKWKLIKLVHPDVLIATAETYSPEEIVELEGGYCTKVVVLEPQATTSTSARIRRLTVDWSKKLIDPLIDGIDRGLPSSDLKNMVDEAVKNA